MSHTVSNQPAPTRREKHVYLARQVLIALLVIGVAWYVFAHLTVTATVTTTP